MDCPQGIVQVLVYLSRCWCTRGLSKGNLYLKVLSSGCSIAIESQEACTPAQTPKHAYNHICTHKHIEKRTHAQSNTPIHKRPHKYTHTTISTLTRYTDTKMHTQPDTQTQAHIRTHTYAHSLSRTHTYIKTHIYIHTRTYTMKIWAAERCEIIGSKIYNKKLQID